MTIMKTSLVTLDIDNTGSDANYDLSSAIASFSHKEIFSGFNSIQSTSIAPSSVRLFTHRGTWSSRSEVRTGILGFEATAEINNGSGDQHEVLINGKITLRPRYTYTSPGDTDLQAEAWEETTVSFYIIALGT